MSYFCLAIPISYKGNEISRVSRIVFEIPILGYFRVYSLCCVCLVTFCAFLHLNFSSTPNSIYMYIIRKPLLRRIQRYILRREILSTFHTRVDNRSIRHFCIVFTCKLPLPFDDHHQYLIHPYRARPRSPPQTASWSISGVATIHIWGPTDGWDECFVPRALRCMRRRANNTKTLLQL